MSQPLTFTQSNILVDGSGCARIADFSLARVTQDLDHSLSALFDRGHAVRWTAPEILQGHGTYSKRADVFSFAMVIIEVRYRSPDACGHLVITISQQIFTGFSPFSHRQPAAVVSAILASKRPPQPAHPSFTNKLWILTQRCWTQDPQLRPEVSEVLQFLHSSWAPSF